MAGKSISELLDQYEPRLRDAFLAAIREITSNAQIGQIAEALERGDVQAAIDALYIDRAAFDVFERALAEAYGDSGANTVGGLPTIRGANGEKIVIRFDARNQRAERILREYSSQFVTRIVDEQRQNIRRVLDEGMRRGDNPRTTALDIVGRINRATGRREGGIVGLSGPQAQYVENARRELLEGRFDEYLQRVRRDKRFDRTIGKAIREGKPLTSDQVGKIVNRYADSLLKLRGDTIGRTEALQSLHMAQHEALLQLVDTGKVTASQITRVWDATADRRTRFDHAVADGKKAGLNERFLVGGRQMLYPGDPAGGAAQVINCRCYVKIKIDFFAGLGNVQPPEDPVQPAPPPRPRFSYKTAKPPANAAQADEFIVSNGIADRADMKGLPIKGLEGAMIAALEVKERFGLGSLSWFGPSKRFGAPGVKNANAAIFPPWNRKEGDPRPNGQRFKGGFHAPGKFGSMAEYEKQHATALKASKVYEQRRKDILAKSHNTYDKEVFERVARMPEGQFGWTISSMSEPKDAAKSITYHEYGHVIHLTNEEIGSKLDAFLKEVRPREKGWPNLLSEYSKKNDKEYIAEAFSLYMGKPASEHYRIHPKLLKLFKELDLEGNS